ncbi:iron uptake porin [Chroococcus sp. FPU101]|uniref:iron uptake porin n=1 Tax=Chroococcus sp. FPU101 TaxID=1974212 RepID=UPI001A8D1697|nr:iron uptake porin [Chroococcus sp. FPU101]GFE71678.1 carbohydrate-selective porin OprB [Chroococcus sp. FPU101]
MKTFSKSVLFILSVLVNINPLLSFSSNAAAEEVLKLPSADFSQFQSQQLATFPQNRPMAQITNVSQLRDVEPTSWAYEALKSLVERYGCIVGYPDRTFRGLRALSRWEFAAGLNACINTLERLLQENMVIQKEDIDKLKRLAQEFETELAVLGTRIDNLENRVAFLEDHQFSTTVKLFGNAIFAIADVFSEDDSNQTVFQYRANLNFISSFTGRDVLSISMFAGNAPIARRDGLDVSTTFNLPGIEVPIPGTNRSIEFSSPEGTLSSQFAANTNNSLQILTIGYSFPVGDSLNIAVLSALAPFQLYTPPLNPYLNDNDSGRGAISVFGEYNPLYTLVGGGTGAILNYKIGNNLQLTAGYLADGLLVGNPSQGNGLFNGGYGALGQLTWNITNNFAIAGVYINDYAPAGRFGFNYNALGVTGTAVANTLAGQDILGAERLGFEQSPVITNGYGFQFNWQPSSRFSLSGWFSTFYPRLIGKGDGNILTYALTFAFPDLGKEGNLLGLVVGAEPYLTDFDGGNPIDFKVDVPWHLEAFYRYQITNSISVTPGLIWLLAPNQDNNNPDAVIGTIRTTFQF